MTPSAKSRGGKSHLIQYSKEPFGKIERGQHFFSYVDENGILTTPLPTDKPDETNPRPIDYVETETIDGNIAAGVASEFHRETTRNDSPN